MKLMQCLQLAKASFVPQSKPASFSDLQRLQRIISTSQKVLVLTGAGVSTESGIPDYRSEGVGLYARSDRRPVQHNSFINESQARQRYWARNSVGWLQFSAFQPNICHQILREWEEKAKLYWLVTQNVDALHYKAGSKNVIELHGSSHRVVCLSCNNRISRWQMEELIEHYNPDWHVESVDIAPDGDVLLSDDQIHGFQVPPCQKCGGILKTDVVFFGANVEKDIVGTVYQLLNACDSLLILGSSLHVYSGYRFVTKAAQMGKKIAIVNIGTSRGDYLADLKISARCGDVLPNIIV